MTPGPMSDSASIPAKPRDSRRCRPQRSLRWIQNTDDSRNAETTRLAARTCGAWHQCLSRWLPSRPVDSAPSLVIRAMTAAIEGPRKNRHCIYGRPTESRSAWQGQEVPKVTPNQRLQRNRLACSPRHLDADPAQAQAAQDTPHCDKLDHVTRP